MDYSLFINKMLKQDSRNRITPQGTSKHWLPKGLKELYSSYELEDAQVILINNCSVKFYPTYELIELQKDYDGSGERFVFATIEGDPIYIMNDEVYRGLHGTEESKLEKLSDSFEDFIWDISINMKEFD